MGTPHNQTEQAIQDLKQDVVGLLRDTHKHTNQAVLALLSEDGSGKLQYKGAPIGGTSDPIGTVKIATSEPTDGDWLPCDGKLRAKADFPDLAARLGHVDKMAVNGYSGWGWAEVRGIAYGNGQFVAVGQSGKLATSSDGKAWVNRNGGFQGSSIYGVAYGNGLFVAVGSSGKLATSSDGAVWTQRQSSFEAPTIWSVTYGNGLFIAVGDSGKLTTSSDGVNWMPVATGAAHLYGITYGNGLFVAVGQSGTIVTSPDGLTWTARSSDFGTSIVYGVAYGNGLFVAVGQSGKLCVSHDGITWLPQPSGFGTTQINGVIATDKLFLAVGHDGKVAISLNGYDWELQAGGFDLTDTLFAAAYGNDLFIVVGAVGGRALTGTSHDGATWTKHTARVASRVLQSVAYGDGQFVAAYTASVFYTSPDGVSWVPRGTTLFNRMIQGIAYGNGQFVAVGYGGMVATSPDGVNWTEHLTVIGLLNLHGVAYGNGLFVVGGDSGRLITSPDGVNWTQRSSSFVGEAIVGIAYGNGQFVAAGQSGKLATSLDGINWTQRSSSFGSTSTIWSVTHAAGLFVAGSTDGKIATSVDGINWIQRISSFGPTDSIFSITYGNGLFVATGSGGKLATSVDGINWTQRTPGYASDDAITGAVYGDGVFVTVGSSGNVHSSSDGITWRNQLGFYGVPINAFAKKGNRIIAVGDRGLILLSDDNGKTWNTIPHAFPLVDFKAATASSFYFYAGGTGGTLLVSIDGVEWTATQNVMGETINALAALVYDNIASSSERVIAVGNYGKIASATTGSTPTFTLRTQPLGVSHYTSIAIGFTSTGTALAVAVTSDGKMVTSPDGTTWTQRMPGLNIDAAAPNIHTVIAAGRKFIAATTDKRIGFSEDGINWRTTIPPLPSTSALALPDGRAALMGAGVALLTYGAGEFTQVTLNTEPALTKWTRFGNTVFAGGTNGEIAVGTIPTYDTTTQFRLPDPISPQVPGWIKAKE